MSKWQKINLATFLVLIFTTVSLIYLWGEVNLSAPFGKPWHLQSSIHEDSLSTIYKNNYLIFGKKSLLSSLYDSSRINVFILVNAWGVPTEEEALAEELKVFKDIPHKSALHRRLANYTSHAEHAEFRNRHHGIYLFAGEPQQFNRAEYIQTLGFSKSIFCKSCTNESIITKIDSVLATLNAPQFIAWTVQATPSGSHNEIHKALQLIANLARRHPNIHIVVQGTHRPVLCNSKTRRTFKSHWVPVVILN